MTDESRKLRVYLVDDHPLLRRGLRALLEAQPDMEVVGEAESGASLVADVAEADPDLVVIDVAMPQVGGARATEELRRAQPARKVLALSAHEERGHVEQMLAAGVSGYVTKRAPPEELLRAIRRVASGDTYLDPSIAGALVAGMVGARAAGEPRVTRLTEREAEVLRLIALGHALKEIAAALDVAVRTVETYRARAMDKAGLKSRADIVRFAAERGWLTST